MNNLLLKDFIFHKNMIPKDLCTYLIEESEKDEWGKHKWYNVESDEHTSYEDKELDVLFPKSDIANQLYEFITSAYEEYYLMCEEKTGNNIFAGAINQCCPPRFNRYNAGTTMRTHYDHIYSLFDGQNKGIPVLSLVGILNDDYSGGEFTFVDDEPIITKTGDIIVFPSCFLYPHQVKEVTQGTRFSFVSWAW